ncbi:MAG: diversity-generating retroelement protein Avd [Patescibacteria group bacterium]|nr:diversity-generating retroelement protein Avd [Patescibacteria group bacterium]
MDNFDIPIFKKSYDLYKTLHEYRNSIPKKDRFTIFERCENILLDIIANILLASSQKPKDKLPTLNNISLKLNLLRVFIRLLKDIKAIDNKKYVSLESMVDEIGKMLGGWIRSTKIR